MENFRKLNICYASSNEYAPYTGLEYKQCDVSDVNALM